jgi:hypothetical protein
MVRLLLELGSPKNSPDVEGWILVKTSIFLTHSNLQKSKQLTPILERLVEKELIDYAYNGQGYLKFRYPKIGTPLSKNRNTVIQKSDNETDHTILQFKRKEIINSSSSFDLGSNGQNDNSISKPQEEEECFNFLFSLLSKIDSYKSKTFTIQIKKSFCEYYSRLTIEGIPLFKTLHSKTNLSELLYKWAINPRTQTTIDEAERNYRLINQKHSKNPR